LLQLGYDTLFVELGHQVLVDSDEELTVSGEVAEHLP